MYLERLSLANFRNFKQLDLSFHRRGNLFFGDNGAGKTNLLEAIFYLSVGRSHRNTGEQELYRVGEDSFSVKGVGWREGGEKVEIEILQNRREGKKVVINHEPQNRVSALIGHLSPVILSGEDSLIVRGAPQERRRFLDFMLSQLSSPYLFALQAYRNVLQQRNRILQDYREGKGEISPTLEVWDEQLVSWGAQIIKKRFEVIQKIAPLARTFYQRMHSSSDNLEVLYRPSFEWEKREITPRFLEELEKNRALEKLRGMTIVGPHRDDLELRLDGLEIKGYGSQGEARTCVIALKLAFTQFLKEMLGTSPLLLLDEVFADLDRKRGNLLLDLLGEYEQVFIATTREADWEEKRYPATVRDEDRNSMSFRRYQVKGGGVTPLE